MKPEMRECQKQGLAYILENPYSILGLQMGLGKSRCIVEARERLSLNCLIICPSYLIGNWIDEIRLWAPSDRVITAVRKGKDIYDLFDTDYAIVSYDLCQRAPQFFEWAQMVACDEAHAIKSMKAKRTEFIHRHIFENSTKRVILATGTPIKNRVQEFYSLLALCNYDPRAPGSDFLDRFPDEITFADYFSFREEYTIEIRNRFIQIVKWNGLRNVKELREYLKGRYIRIKSADAIDLPPITFKDVRVGDTQDLALKEAFEAFVASQDGGVNPTAKAEAALKKAPITVKYAKDLIENTGCALIYTDHVESSKAIAKEFGVEPLNGLMPSQKRMDLAKRFQAGEGNVLVATIGALSTGVTLTRANHLILSDPCWTPGDLQQIFYRIQRIGQKERCFVHRILGSETDKYIYKVLDEKMAVIEKAT